MAMKYFINASNLHSGGALQVAVSFLYELRKNFAHNPNLFFYLSSEIISEMRGYKIYSQDENLLECNTGGVSSLFISPKKVDFAGATSVFTIFGPLYRLKRSFFNIVGFAQPWIVYPDNECYAELTFLSRIATKLKYSIQAFFFKRSDILVVELEHVKNKLMEIHNIPASRIKVVRNCVSSLFFDEMLWEDFELPKVSLAGEHIRIGFVGRNYLHKNTKIFPDVANYLYTRYNIKVIFYVTFTEKEWNNASEQFRQSCINVGPLSVAQCPNFYKNMDAIIFPSLLECFSATPLEALAMKKPLFASDRIFNREICGDFASYFDPVSPSSAGDLIYQDFFISLRKQKDLEMAREHAINFSNPLNRAKQYMSILMAYDKNTNF